MDHSNTEFKIMGEHENFLCIRRPHLLGVDLHLLHLLNSRLWHELHDGGTFMKVKSGA